MAGTSGRQRVQNDVLKRFQVKEVKPQIFEKFNLAMSSLFNKICFNSLQNNGLIIMRDSLLPKLISGEIRVGEAEKIV
jgi:type I restriction enzyme S subunit